MAPKEKLARGRGSAFSSKELTFLLCNIEKVLPVAVSGWDSIEELHREKHPAWNSEALKRKFKTLQKSEVPADESNVMYMHITRAKAARKRIVEVLKENEDARIKRKEEAVDGSKQRLGEKDLDEYCKEPANSIMDSDVNNMTSQKQKQSLADGNKISTADTSCLCTESKKKGVATTFENNEVQSLLKLVEENVPVRLHEWDLIYSKHQQSFPSRTRESLKRKFTSLLRTPVPEGARNPNCVLARQLNIKMKEKQMRNSIPTSSGMASPDKSEKKTIPAKRTGSKFPKGAKKSTEQKIRRQNKKATTTKGRVRQQDGVDGGNDDQRENEDEVVYKDDSDKDEDDNEDKNEDNDNDEDDEDNDDDDDTDN
jgi:hypothetical protein